MITILLVVIFNVFLFLATNKLIKYYNIFDCNNKKSKKISLIGGFYLYINIILIFTLFLIFDQDKINIFIFNKRTLFSFYLVMTMIFVMGYLDDKYNLSPNFKLFSMIIIIFIDLTLNENLILNKIKLSSNFHFYINDNLQFIFTLLCFITIINLLNMFDGINLQSILFSFFIFIICFQHQNIFLLFNFLIFYLLISYLNYKNIIYLGNSGSYLLGYFIGYIMINSYHNNLINADHVSLLLIIPFIDMLRLIMLRIIKKKHIFLGDNNHIHHTLLKKIGYHKTLFAIQSLIIFPVLLFLNMQISIFILLPISIFLYFVIL